VAKRSLNSTGQCFISKRNLLTLKIKAMIKKATFTDAQQVHREHPDTFDVPSDKELSEIQPGSIVKVCSGGERFWAEVKSIKDGVITAVVDNDLIQKKLRFGDVIRFQTKNVYDIY
jgi:hypothetical protein